MDARQQTSQLQLAGKTFDNSYRVSADKTSTPAHILAEQGIVNSPSFVCDPSDPRMVLTFKYIQESCSYNSISVRTF